MNKKIKIASLFLSGILLATTSIATSIILVSCNEKDNHQDSNSNNVNIDGTKIFNQLNGTLTANEWKDKKKTKIENKIKIGLKASLESKYKDKVVLKTGSIIVIQPTKNNGGTIKFKVNFDPNLKIKIKNNDNVSYSDSDKLIIIKNLVLKNDTNVDSELLFNALNWKFTNQEWKEKTKLVEAIKNVLIAKISDNKNNVNCIINNDPIIPTSVASNDGTISFKITTSKDFQFEIQNTSNVSYDKNSKILTITNLNLIKPIEIAIDLNFANWIIKFIQDAYDRTKNGNEFGNFLRTDLISAISEKLGIDCSKYIEPQSIWMMDGFPIDGKPIANRVNIDLISKIMIPLNGACLVAKDKINIKLSPNDSQLLFNYKDNCISVPIKRKQTNFKWYIDEAINFVNKLIDKNNIISLQDIRTLIINNTIEIAQKFYYIDENNQKHYLDPSELISPLNIYDSIWYIKSISDKEKFPIYYLEFPTKNYGLLRPDPGFINDNIEKIQKTPTKEQFYKAYNVIDTIAKNSKTKNEFVAISDEFNDVFKDCFGLGSNNDICTESDVWFGNLFDGSSFPFYSLEFSQNIFVQRNDSNIEKNKAFFDELGITEYMDDWYTVKVNDNLIVQYSEYEIYFRVLKSTPEELNKICPDSQCVFNFNKDFYNELASIIEINQYPIKWFGDKEGYCQYLNDTKNEELMKLFDKYIVASDNHHSHIYWVNCNTFQNLALENSKQDSIFISYAFNESYYLNRQIFDKNIPIKWDFFDSYMTGVLKIQVILPSQFNK